MNKKKNIFLWASWSIAAIKTQDIYTELRYKWCETTWSATKSAECYILNKLLSIIESDSKKPYDKCRWKYIWSLQHEIREVLPRYIEQSGESLDKYFPSWANLMHYYMWDSQNFLNNYESWIDYEWVSSKEKGHVKHINIAQEVDAALIAPASANTLSKIVNGITDNFLLEVIRAIPRWKKVYLAPAMNTEMLQDPFIQENIRKLETMWSDKYEIIYPVSKVLQCWIEWDGAMADVKDIVERIIW